MLVDLLEPEVCDEPVTVPAQETRAEQKARRFMQPLFVCIGGDAKWTCGQTFLDGIPERCPRCGKVFSST